MFLAVLIVGVSLALSIGPAWDEPDNIFSGGQYWNFFQSGFKPSILLEKDAGASIFGNIIYTQEPDLARYPPIPNYVGTAFAVIGHQFGMQMTGPNVIVAFHIATVVFFAILVVTVYAFGGLMGLPIAGRLFAACAIFLYPTMFGHGLSDLKDTAQVALFTLSLYLLLRSLVAETLEKHASGVINKFTITGAIVWGLAIATKFNAVYVQVIAGVWIVCTGLPALFTHDRKNPKLFGQAVGTIFIYAVIGLTVAFIVWPYLWFDPVHRIVEVVRYFTTVGQGYQIFWNGTLYQVGVGKSLWWYPWANLLLATPIVVLFAIGLGFLRSVAGIFLKHKENRIPFLLILWILIPLSRAIMPSAAFYDGIRHFMEVLPPLMLLAAFGVGTLISGRWRWVLPLAAVIIIGYLIVIDVNYAPYSSGYFNAFAANPNVLYDRDIEALSVHEAMQYLDTNYTGARVWVPIGGHLSWYYLKAGDEYVYNSGDADSIVLVNKSSHFSEKEFVATLGGAYVPVYTVTRQGAVFAWVFRKKE